MDYTVHGILQARMLEWVAIPFSRASSYPGIEPRSHTLQEASLPAELPGKLNKKHPELIKRKYIIFQDNARLHVSLMTRQKLLQLGWEVLIHLPCSLDISPSNFYLFWSLQNSLNGKKGPFPERL